MKLKLKIMAISLFTKEFELINTVEFNIDKINIIAGISSSGKTQILECLKYGLFASQSNIENDMLGKVLGYVAVNININESVFTLIRRYSTNGTEIIYISNKYEEIKNLNSELLASYEKYNKARFSAFLNEYLLIPNYLNSINKTFTAKNIFIYSFIDYENVSSIFSLVERGNLFPKDYLALNYLVFNIFDEEEVIESIENLVDNGLGLLYNKEKENIEEIKRFLREYYDKSIINYINYAKKLIQCEKEGMDCQV